MFRLSGEPVGKGILETLSKTLPKVIHGIKIATELR